MQLVFFQMEVALRMMMVCVVKGCVCVTDLYEGVTCLCHIQINKCVVTLTAEIEIKLCSVSVAWRKKKSSGVLRVLKSCTRTNTGCLQLIWEMSSVPCVDMVQDPQCLTAEYNPWHFVVTEGTMSNVLLSPNITQLAWESQLACPGRASVSAPFKLTVYVASKLCLSAETGFLCIYFIVSWTRKGLKCVPFPKLSKITVFIGDEWLQQNVSSACFFSMKSGLALWVISNVAWKSKQPSSTSMAALRWVENEAHPDLSKWM